MEEYDPQVMREVMNDLQTMGKVSKETSDRIAAQGSTLEKYTQKLAKATSNASKDILSSAKNLAAGLVEGQRKFSDLNPVIDGVTNAIASLTGAIPLLGGILSGAARATAEAGKIMLRQMDIQTKAFTDVGDIGGLAADGLEGLKDQFLESGLTLDSYAKALRNSSTTLARFSGTVASGAQVFSLAAHELTQGVDVELRRLGFSADDLGETLEAFVGRQTRLGRSQGLDHLELARQTQDYAKELDLLSRATGLSRKAIMQQQDAALSEARFRSTIEGIQNEGVRTNLLNFQTSVAAVNQGLGQGIRDMTSGFFNTEEAQSLMVQTGGEAASILGDLRGGLIDEFEARKRLQLALRQNSIQLLTELGPAIGEASLATRNAAGVFDLANADVTTSGFEVKREQKGLAGGTNDLTANIVNAQKNIEAMNIGMQKLFLAAMPKAAGAVEKFTDLMLVAIGKVSRRFLGEATQEEKDNMQQWIPGGVAPGGVVDGLVKSSYEDAQKNLLAAGVKPDADIVRVAQIGGVHEARKISGASDDTPLMALGMDPKFGAYTAGEYKSTLANMNLESSGPKQTYTSSMANLDTTDTIVAEADTTKQTTMSRDMTDSFKMLAKKLDETNEILTKGNRIGMKQVQASYS